MSKTNIFFLSLLVLAACNNGQVDHGSAAATTPAKPGTLIAHGEMAVPEDTLNHFVFSVKVLADSAVGSGIYDVEAALGPNIVTGKFTLPRGAEDAIPQMRRGTDPISYVIGFKMANDTAFNEYFEVSSDLRATKMEYIRSYTFERK